MLFTTVADTLVVVLSVIARKKIRFLIVAMLYCVAVFFAPYLVISYSQHPKISYSIEALQPREYAIVFGARVYRGSIPSDAAAERVNAAVQLYKAGKVKALFISGDNSNNAETDVLTQLAIKGGVPAHKIAVDHWGTNTLLTCHHFLATGKTDAVLVTQYFHLPRALYMCEREGLAVTGLAANNLGLLAERGPNVLAIYVTRVDRFIRETALTWAYVVGIYDNLANVHFVLPHPQYCERTQHNFTNEPLNALSNAAFMVAAVASYYYLARQKQKGKKLYVLSILLAVIGAGSLFYHTVRSNLTLLLDALPIYIFILSSLYIFLKKLTNNTAKTWLSLGTLLAVEIGLSILIGNRHYQLAIRHVVALLFFGLLIFRYRHQLQPVRRWLWAIGSLYALAIGIKTIDLPLCKSIPVGTHFMWHLLNALTGYLVIRFFSLIEKKRL